MKFIKIVIRGSQIKFYDNEFIRISDTLWNQYLANSRKKVIGYYCSYFPEELFYAADLIPFRIRSIGEKSTDLADVYMVRFTCSYIRATFNLALKGEYNFLEGFFTCNSCDHSRRMYELYDLVAFKKRSIPLFYISVPHILSEVAFDWFYQEINELKSEIEQTYEVAISKEKLLSSIEIYNENRKLMREIDKYRKNNPSLLSGTDFLRINLSNTSVPKEIANENLRKILDKVSNLNSSIKGKKRILIVGSAIDSPDFINLVEETGANVVSDFMCFGDRNIKNDILLNSEDPLKSISNRLYYKISCPRIMNDHENRLKFLLKEINETEVDGVILQRITNCDLHGCDNMLFEHELKDLNIPILNIDREVFLEDKIRLRTRIEAFLEIM